MNIAAQRLYNQRLIDTTLKTPSEVVAWLGAVQAQEYSLARWGLGLRLQRVGDADIEKAFDEGAILRTHVMRPTWHFVTPADIRWILELTAPRVHVANAYMYRKLELDEALFVRSNEALAKALQGGRQLTRVELGTVLADVGIQAEGMRLGYIVHRAELDQVVCSGARRGKQFTYALLEERVPEARILERDEALVELTVRYFTSHGPARVEDFAWWSGLTKADVKKGLEMAKGQLVSTVLDGKTYWHAASMPAAKDVSGRAFLLPPYDEYGIAYKDHSAIIADPAFMEQARNATFGGVTVMDGQVVGNWRRTLSKGAVVIESAPFRPFSAAEQEGFSAAAQRFGDFLGVSVVLT